MKTILALLVTFIGWALAIAVYLGGLSLILWVGAKLVKAAWGA